MRVQLWPSHESLRGFLFGLRSLIFSDAETLRPRCFVTTTVLFLTEQFKKKRFVPRPCFFPASRKTTPSSVAGCLVRISGSSVVCSDRSSYPLIINSGVLLRERPGSFMAVILAGERAVWGKLSRLRGCGVFAIKLKQVVCAPPD